MEDVNKTLVTEFILLAFADLNKFQILLFTIILLTYIVCIVGNIAIILLVRIEHSLHTPMYFFISIFAVVEVLFVSVPIPKLLANLIVNNNRISFYGCFAQVYSFNALGEIECFVIVIMVYDRHLAINKPLHYTTMMNHNICILLAVLPWLFGSVISFILTLFTACLEFCGSNKINHFFCDLAPLQSLACSSTFVSNVVTSTAAVFAIIVPFLLIIGFYIQILTTISKIKGNEGRYKSFSTCSSHLIVASLFYGTAFIVYVKPNGSHYDKFLALMYTVVTPLLNPFIYTLRNRDVKSTFKKIFYRLLKENAC